MRSGGKADDLVDRSARQSRRQRAAGLMVCSLSTITASIAEHEKGGNVAATPKGFFEVFMQLALYQNDGTKKMQKSKRGMPFDWLPGSGRMMSRGCRP
jgi:hypothetical protein